MVSAHSLNALRHALAAALVLAACAQPEQTRLELGPLTTDRDEYTARYLDGRPPFDRYGFTLVAQFHNRTSDSLYLARCYPDSPEPLYGVEAVGDSGEAAYSPIWACVGHDRAIQVGPGETRTDTLSLSGPNGWTGQRVPDGELAGRFRLGYRVQQCPQETFECGILDPLTLSEPFEVRVPAWDRMRPRISPRRAR